MMKSCLADDIHKELDESEIESLLDNPNDLPMEVERLKNTIIHSNTKDFSYTIDYRYSCTGLAKDMPLKYFTVSSRTIDKQSLNYSLFKNGMVAKSSCSNKKGFYSENISKLYYRECAKSKVLSLFQPNQGVFANSDNSIEYIQWCILEESDNSVEILEFIKFEKPMKNISEYEGLLNTCYEDESQDC